jgi:hypothetical protein
VRFFLDNCISYRLAPALTVLSELEGHQIIALREKFPEDAADENWLLALSQEREWVVISGDARIYRNVQRRKVWTQARLTTFFWQPAWNKANYWEKAWLMVRWWPDITRTASIFERGSGFSVPRSINGKLKPI